MIKWQRLPLNSGYEVSSLGDKRFSALFAKMSDGRTIEAHYQCDIKGYDVGGTNWKLGKGKPPLKKMSQEQLREKYLELWLDWAKLNKKAVKELYKTMVKLNLDTLTDRFAKTNISQAWALSEIINNYVISGAFDNPDITYQCDLIRKRS